MSQFAHAEKFSIWDIGVPISAPCADLSFERLPGSRIRILMKFSLVNGGMPNDLEVILDGVIALRWAEEAVHSISVKWPRPLPEVSSAKWKGWTYPLLAINDSAWLAEFEGIPSSKGRKHFAFVAMNDVIEVIAQPNPTVRWILAEGD